MDLIEKIHQHLQSIKEDLFIDEISDTIKEFLTFYSKKKLKIQIKNWRETFKTGNPSRLFISMENPENCSTTIEIYLYESHCEGSLTIETPHDGRKDNSEDIVKDFNFKYNSPKELKNKLIETICYWIVNRWEELKKDYTLLQDRAEELNKKDFISQVKFLLRKTNDSKFGYADNLVLDALDQMIKGHGFDIDYGNIPETNSVLLQIIANSLTSRPVEFNLLNKYINIVKKGINILVNHQLKILLKKSTYINKLNKEDLEEFAREAKIPLEQIIIFSDEQEANDWVNFCLVMGEEFVQVLNLINTSTSNTFIKGIKGSKYVSALLVLADHIYESEFFR